jgi:hypothetical protein
MLYWNFKRKLSEATKDSGTVIPFDPNTRLLRFDRDIVYMTIRSKTRKRILVT